MSEQETSLIDRLVQIPPFGCLPAAERGRLAAQLKLVEAKPGDLLFEEGQPLSGLLVISIGAVEVFTRDDQIVMHRGPGDIMGERGLLRDGTAMLSARASEHCEMLLLPTPEFLRLKASIAELGRWFDRSGPDSARGDEGPAANGLMSLQVSDMMAREPVGCLPSLSVQDVAIQMRDHGISSIMVSDDSGLKGIVTVHDLVNKVLAEGLDGNCPVDQVMTPDPITISPHATGLDAMLQMAERRINHLPVADATGAIIGLVGRTDLFRRQAMTASHMASQIVTAASSADMRAVMERLPDLLVQLSASGARPAAICRRITDLTDAATRRLLALGEEKFGTPPVPYLWAACGSQGRREQAGVSDQDNCLILDDAMQPEHDAYFARLAKFVSDGLDDIGFFFCPGDMMATNPKWRQPAHVWRNYFARWIDEPDEMAQMLASVMFDLRPIAGETSLFVDLQSETLKLAQGNSIFVRHMVGNSLKHAPPLGTFWGLSVIRSGEHKNTLDLKHAGVVPIVDLGRVYALRAGITVANTRERLEAAGALGVISKTGARDVLDAYDLIAETRLKHQARQISSGRKPDNFLNPNDLSELERNHLRDAFLVVRTMQSSLGNGS